MSTSSLISTFLAQRDRNNRGRTLKYLGSHFRHLMPPTGGLPAAILFTRPKVQSSPTLYQWIAHSTGRAGRGGVQLPGATSPPRHWRCRIEARGCPLARQASGGRDVPCARLAFWGTVHVNQIQSRSNRPSSHCPQVQWICSPSRHQQITRHRVY